jgi:hypothetical protein
VIALEGQQAPGVEEGIAFETFSPPDGQQALNSFGKMAFVATLSDGGQGLWTERRGDGLTLIARRGDNAPGLDADEHLSGLNGLSINDRNDIAFSASYTTGDGTYENGVWMEQQGALQLIARTGDPLPGLPADTAFNYGWLLRPSDRPVALLNASYLTGTSIDEPNSGLWARTATGELHLVALEGDLMNVSDDPNAPDLRRIRVLHSAAIDDLGYISFGAFFSMELQECLSHQWSQFRSRTPSCISCLGRCCDSPYLPVGGRNKVEIKASGTRR